VVGAAARLGPGARVIVPTIAVVATMLLAATLEQHLHRFHGLVGLAWVEIYSVFRPLLGGLVMMQLAVPGRDRNSGAQLPRGLRAALAGLRSPRSGSASRCVPHPGWLHRCSRGSCRT
jgi:hypothetical protein